MRSRLAAARRPPRRLDTSDEAVTTAETFAEAIGKTPIRTKDRSGFIVNMLLERSHA